MEQLPDGHLVVHPVPHPNRAVHQAGFGLDHPYIERCWAPVVGPSSVLLLRRFPELWRDAVPASVDFDEFSRTLGLGRSTGRHSKLARTIDRLVTFGFARRAEDGSLEVFTTVRPVPENQVARLPRWTQDAHEHLLTSHLAGLAAAAGQPTPAVSPPIDIAARLDNVARAATAPLTR